MLVSPLENIFLPSLLIDFQKDYPELELHVVIGNTEEIVQSVKLFQVDIGLIEGQTNEKDLSVHPFMQDELFIVSSPIIHFQKENVTITDLQNQTWVTREVGSGTGEYLNHVIRSNGLKVKSLLTISSNQGIKETLMNGYGLSSYHAVSLKGMYSMEIFRSFNLKTIPSPNIILCLFPNHERQKECKYIN